MIQGLRTMTHEIEILVIAEKAKQAAFRAGMNKDYRDGLTAPGLLAAT